MKQKKKRAFKRLSEEHKINIGLANKGKKHTEETKRNLSETWKKLYAEGTIIHPWIGRKHTEETKKKISENHYDCSGSNGSQWKGGITYSRGRKYIYTPNHPNKTNGNYVRESRLIMEKKIGRYLTRKEIVHHIDGDKINNNPENLYLFENQSKHWKYHLHLRRIVKKMVRGNKMIEKDENIRAINKFNEKMDKLMAYLIPETEDVSDHLHLAKRLLAEVNPPELEVIGKYPRKQPTKKVAVA